MVAAAERAEGLQPWMPMAALAVIVVFLTAAPFVLRQAQLAAYLPLDKPPAALEDRARELAAALGQETKAGDSTSGWSVDVDYLQWIAATDPSPGRWDRLRSGRPPALKYWFRHSPRPLVSTAMIGRVSATNPPPLVSGMSGVELDLQGRLLSYYAVPPQVEDPSAPAAAPDWSTLFTQARLDPARFTAAPSRWTPPVHSDARAAWTGPDPERGEVTLRVEAAAYRGRPVYFQIIGPWTRAERMQDFQWTATQTVANRFGAALILTVVVASLALARRNLRLGRGDRQGARRLAGTAVSIVMVTWVLFADHVADVFGELSLLVRAIGLGLTLAAAICVLYLAVEPYLRRGWPDTLISWTRLLGGRVNDPLVGRDLLAGIALGAVFTVTVPLAGSIVPRLLGLPSAAPGTSRIDALLGPRMAAASLIDDFLSGMVGGLFTILIMLILRLLLRRERLAGPAFVVLNSLQIALRSGASLGFMIPACMLLVGLPLYVALRIGVLTCVTCVIVAEWLISAPMLAPTHWGSELGWMSLAAVAAVTAYAFRISRPGSLGAWR
jgi:hypothetical protein